MKLRLSMWLCVAVASTVAASAATISFSGSGASGTTMAPGEPWEYHAPIESNNEYNWGSPGPNRGATQWVGSLSVKNFEISFDLPSGVAIDLGTSAQGSDFHSLEGGNNYTWTPSLINANTILFTDPSSDPVLNNTGSYFVNIFFTGKVTDSSFSGTWGVAPTTSSPEPGPAVLIATGLVGIVAWVRRRRAL